MVNKEAKVVVVTGGTSGIGRACVERFAVGGWRVVIAARRRHTGEALAERLGPKVHFVQTDVAIHEDIERLVGQTVERFGRIDCFVSNAGTGSSTGPISATEASALEQDLAVHLMAPFLAMKYASHIMVERGSGSFVNVSSISARSAGFNSFGYEVAKAALTHLTRCAALELGEKGLRVNSVSPGPTLTSIFARHIGREAGTDEVAGRIEAAFSQLLPTIQPMSGMIRPEDIAAAVWFLSSDDARFVNGHDLVVDGGITAGRPAQVMRESWRLLGNAFGAEANT